MKLEIGDMVKWNTKQSTIEAGKIVGFVKNGEIILSDCLSSDLLAELRNELITLMRTYDAYKNCTIIDYTGGQFKAVSNNLLRLINSEDEFNAIKL